MKYEEYMSKLYRPPVKKSTRGNLLCLDKNEPPFSAFDSVDGLINDKDILALRVYPDLYELYVKLVKFIGEGVGINEVLITHGSGQAIEFVFRAFLGEGEEVVSLNPSFALLDVFAYIQKANVKHVEFDNNLDLGVKNIISSVSDNTKLLVLANPNNPTGTAFCLDELYEIAAHTETTNTIFLLDEAYFHFYSIESVKLIKKYQHVIITRTFSKALGIAGSRVGYAISNYNNIQLIRKFKPIHEIDQLSNIVAKKVLDNADEILEKNVNQVNKWKNFFKTIKLKNIQYIHTEGNFILLKSSSYTAHKKIFLDHNIQPKMDFSHKCLMNCFRLSVTSDSKMQNIVDILKKYG